MKYTISELKKICKDNGIKGYSKINKKNKEEFIKKCLKFEKPKLPKRKPKTKKKVSIKKTPPKKVKTPKKIAPKDVFLKWNILKK